MGCVSPTGGGDPNEWDKNAHVPADLGELPAMHVELGYCTATPEDITCNAAENRDPLDSGHGFELSWQLIAADYYATHPRFRQTVRFPMTGLTFPVDVRVKGWVYQGSERQGKIAIDQRARIDLAEGVQSVRVDVVSSALQVWPVHVVLQDAADQSYTTVEITVTHGDRSVVKMEEEVDTEGGTRLHVGMFEDSTLSLRGLSAAEGIGIEQPGYYVLHEDGSLTPATEDAWAL